MGWIKGSWRPADLPVLKVAGLPYASRSELDAAGVKP
jgi:hypothetical protein